MSKLTNHQIRRHIESLQSALQRDAERNGEVSTPDQRRRRRKLDAYLEELAEREAAGIDPRTNEIQEDRRG